MLLHLSIRDFAIVDRLELEFRPGFTALTGETGAGKSILIDALSLTLDLTFLNYYLDKLVHLPIG